MDNSDILIAASCRHRAISKLLGEQTELLAQLPLRRDDARVYRLRWIGVEVERLSTDRERAANEARRRKPRAAVRRSGTVSFRRK